MCKINQSAVTPSNIESWELPYIFNYITNYHRLVYMDICNHTINSTENDKTIILQQIRSHYISQLKKTFQDFSKIIHINDYIWFKYCMGVRRLSDQIKYCEKCISNNMFEFNEADFNTNCGHYYCQKCLYELCYNSPPVINCMGIRQNYECWVCNKKIKNVKIIAYDYENCCI